MMKKIMLAVGVLSGLLSAVNAQVSFDRGVDVGSFVLQAVNSDLATPAPGLGRTYTTRDCARLSFGPGDNEMLSEKVRLRSVEYVTECYTVPGPNGQPVQNCHERPGMSWSRTGQIKILPRKLWAWEQETFELCLNGPWLDVYADEAGYQYSVRRVGDYDTLFELAPQHKIAMRADENGLSCGDFSYAAGKYTFKVNDRWAGEYAGEKVVIKVELYKDNPNWLDSSRGAKEFTFDAAGGYTMTFSEKDLEQPQAPDPDSNFRGSGKFYVKWGFKRVGAISKDNFAKKGETPAVEVN
jgi:hypothetical protein